MRNLRKLRKGFVTISVLILGTFFVTVIVAMNSFNSQIKYSNERNIIEKQIYYNAYAGIQKAILEIKKNRNCSIGDYFYIGDNMQNLSPKTQKYYTFLKVTNEANGTKYSYTVESTGYGKFKEEVLSQEIIAKITVDYIEETGIIRFDSIEIK